MLLPELIDLIYENFEYDKLDQLCLSKRHFYRDEVLRKKVLNETNILTLNIYNISGTTDAWKIFTSHDICTIGEEDINGCRGRMIDISDEDLFIKSWIAKDDVIFVRNCTISRLEIRLAKYFEFNLINL
jgi:hypothetical protein